MSEHESGSVDRWEVHLTYPRTSSHSGEATAIVDAETRDKAVSKAKRDEGMSSADAYPVYRLERDVQTETHGSTEVRDDA
jgi:hypothetical protein